MGTTISDVARAAGVAPSTVSRVLSGQGAADPATRTRVQEAAESLGYRANRAAASLRGSTTRRIALIVPDLTNPFFAGIAAGVQSRARELEYTLLIADNDDDPRVELKLLASLAGRADGVLLATPRISDSELGSLSLPSPLVLLHRVHPSFPYVITDIADGVRQAVENLVALGHTQIGYVDGPPESWSAGLRRSAVADLDLPLGVEVRNLCQVPAKFEGGVVAGDVVVDSGVTAVLAFNDIICLGLQHRLVVRGVRVPDEVSLVGYDGIPAAAMVTPALTTVAQPLAQSGRIGVDVLVRVLRGLPTEHRTLLAPHLVVRDSSGPLRPPSEGRRTV